MLRRYKLVVFAPQNKCRDFYRRQLFKFFRLFVCIKILGQPEWNILCMRRFKRPAVFLDEFRGYSGVIVIDLLQRFSQHRLAKQQMCKRFQPRVYHRDYAGRLLRIAKRVYQNEPRDALGTVYGNP